MLAQLSGSLLHSPFISTEAEGVGRAWTLPGSLHLHSGRGSLEGPGPGLASATHSTPISASQQWACHHQPYMGIFSMALSPCFCLLKRVGEGCCVLSVPGQVACMRTQGITSLGALLMAGNPWALAPTALPAITNTGAMAEQFPGACEFSFQILPETHSLLWIPTGAPMLHALEKRKWVTRPSTQWEHSWGSKDKTVKMDPH